MTLVHVLPPPSAGSSEDPALVANESVGLIGGAAKWWLDCTMGRVEICELLAPHGLVSFLLLDSKGLDGS